ncbi:MAG: hypothetical protein KAY24_12650, partial [Candidatus Eisenbacteria sp.]|nr:hypothetical protein [Candidatus Eisenbacteria bacterium]
MKPAACMVRISIVLLTALACMGCEDQNAPRSRLLITRIADISTESYSYDYALLSDVETYGSVFEDEIYLTVQNLPRSSLFSYSAGGPYGDAVLTRYTVEYELEDEHIEPIAGGMHLVVPSGSETIARIVIVAAITKTLPPLNTLLTELDEFFVTARITLYGYEESSNEALEAHAAMQIHFANWA